MVCVAEASCTRSDASQTPQPQPALVSRARRARLWGVAASAATASIRCAFLYQLDACAALSCFERLALHLTLPLAVQAKRRRKDSVGGAVGVVGDPNPSVSGLKRLHVGDQEAGRSASATQHLGAGGARGGHRFVAIGCDRFEFAPLGRTLLPRSPWSERTPDGFMGSRAPAASGVQPGLTATGDRRVNKLLRLAGAGRRKPNRGSRSTRRCSSASS